MSQAIVVDDLQFAWPDGAVLLGLAARFLRRPDVLLLDEPTNNLDLDARKRQAEVAAGKHRGMQIEKLELARERRGVRGGPRRRRRDPGRPALLRTIGITRWLRLEGRLIRIDPP